MLQSVDIHEKVFDIGVLGKKMQPTKQDTVAFTCHDKSVLKECAVTDQFYISSIVLAPFTRWRKNK